MRALPCIHCVALSITVVAWDRGLRLLAHFFLSYFICIILYLIYMYQYFDLLHISIQSLFIVCLFLLHRLCFFDDRNAFTCDMNLSIFIA